MADIVNSLFGLTPRETEQQLLKQNYDLGSLIGSATLNPYDTAVNQQAYINQQGAMAALGGQAVRGIAGVFGVQDEQLQRATTLEAILQETQQELGADAQDPAKMYGTLYNKLNQAGFSREAMQVGQLAQKAIQEQNLNVAKIGNENAQAVKFKAEALKALRQDDPNEKLFFELAKNATPQSVAKAVAAKYDFSLLDSPEKTKYSPMAQELIDAGLVYKSPEFNAKMLELIDANKTGKAKGSGNVSVSLGGISVDAGKVSEEAGKEVGKAVADIETQYSQLADFENAKKMLNKGIFAGPYGPAEMSIAKSTRQNVGKVANTEKFKAYIASNVIKRLKDIGGNDTKEERDYLESMVGGDITFEPSSILSVIESGEQKIKDIIARRKLQVESASKGTQIPLNPIKPIKRFNPNTGKLESK